MRVYVDSSALLKRVVDEDGSTALVSALRAHHADGDVVLASSLAWIEVSRALKRALPDSPEVNDLADAALSGVFELPITPEVVSLARRVQPTQLRSLDAIHVASALLVDADRVLAFDDRLAYACAANDLAVTIPGRD